ncbi:MAG: restriction endonuclease subunit S [Vicinamibacterales bacterium]
MKAAWAIAPLGELSEVLDWRRRPITKRERVPGPYPYYGATGVLDHVAGYLFDEPLVLVGEDGAKWGSGDGTAFPVQGKCWVNNHAHVLRPHRDRALDGWLIAYLNHLDLIGFVSGLTVPKLNQGSLREIPIPVPPVEEQRRIVAILDEAFAAIATAEANTEKGIEGAREAFGSALQSKLSRGGREWAKTTLGEAVDLLAGFAFQSARYTDSPDGVRLLRGDNIVQNALRWDDVKRWPVSDESAHQRYRLVEGDVVLAMDRPWVQAGLKRAMIRKEDLPCLLVQRTARLRPGPRLDRRFLCHLLSTEAFAQHLLGMQTGIGVPHISARQIQSFAFLRPPRADQARIADELDELHGDLNVLGALHQQKVAALDALKQSLLHQAFSGEL